MKLRPHGLTAEILTFRIRSLVRAYRLRSRFLFSALPLKGTLDASPKAISRRTSYHPVRLEFLPYAQLIPYFCSNSGSGPPVVVTPRSSWPCVAHAGFGSNSCDIKDRTKSNELRVMSKKLNTQNSYFLIHSFYGLFILAFTTISSLVRLNQAAKD